MLKTIFLNAIKTKPKLHVFTTLSGLCSLESSEHNLVTILAGPVQANLHPGFLLVLCLDKLEQSKFLA